MKMPLVNEKMDDNILMGEMLDENHSGGCTFGFELAVKLDEMYLDMYQSLNVL
jgi:hypothetical protein